MDETKIEITIAQSMSDEGRTAFLRTIAVVVAVFSRATIPTLDDLVQALQAKLPKPERATR